MYTLDEAAKILRKTPRWLREWLRGHPVDRRGELFYTPLGRTKVFDDRDIARICDAARGDERRRLESFRSAAQRRKAPAASDATSAAQWAKVAELLGDPSLARPGAAANNGSRGKRRKIGPAPARE